MIQLNLVFLYFAKKRKDKKKLAAPELEELPFVTIQLPIYNELYVVERLIDSIGLFTYPRDRFEVQVLDDSNDETVGIIAEKVKEWKAKGLDIEHIQRPDRVGFKAGALQYGMDFCKGEFIAIFDADFLPIPDFLSKTLPYFHDPKTGVVQTKWKHINEDYSLITKLQAFGLDAHFSIEQGGRNHGGHFINFNGTAGIWRKTCIYDAGGWSADTLTEDLDLSYRAQLKGWHFEFLEEVGSPAELPVAMNALKSQQFRWTKGAAECARKNLWKVMRAKDVGFSTKLHAVFHLMNSFIFISILSASILSLPLFYIKIKYPEYDVYYRYGTYFFISTVFLMIFYWTSCTSQHSNKFKSSLEFIMLFPVFLSFSMGLSLHNGIAVLEGYVGRKTPFIRTPKFNVEDLKDGSWVKTKYLVSSINWMTILEGLMALYFIAGIFLSYYFKNYSMLPFFIMLAIGFGFVFYYSVKHSNFANQ